MDWKSLVSQDACFIFCVRSFFRMQSAGCCRLFFFSMIQQWISVLLNHMKTVTALRMGISNVAYYNDSTQALEVF